MRFLLNTAPRGNCPERRALPERAGKYSDRKTLVSVMLFPRPRRPYGSARPLAALSGSVTPVLFDQASVAIKPGFATVVADLKSQPFSESRRRE